MISPGRARLLRFIGVFLGVTGGIGVAVLFSMASSLPRLRSLADYQPPQLSRVIGADGRVLGEYFRERRRLVPLSEIPKSLRDAFLSAEDKGFFEHRGLSFSSIGRALFRNLRTGRVVQGGSTISQQVAKSLLGSSERSLLRKARELLLAGFLEKDLNKEEILTIYLNQIYLGSSAYGVVVAAETYFNKTLSELSIAEAALIAGVTPAPAKYSPLINPLLAKQRQEYVLGRMRESGVIKESEFEAARRETLRLWRAAPLHHRSSPYFLEQVRRELVERVGEDRLMEGGLSIRVSASWDSLVAARQALQAGLRELDLRRGFRGPLHSAESEANPTRSQESLTKLNRSRVPGFEGISPDGKVAPLDPERAAGASEHFKGLLPREVYDARVVLAGGPGPGNFGSVDLGVGVLPLEAPLGAQGASLRPGDHILVSLQQKKRMSASPRWIARLEQTPLVEGALVAFDLETGGVLALEGGYDFGRSAFHRAIQAKRQTGSTFKPFIFAAAIESGMTAATPLLDAPIVQEKTGEEDWIPSNSDQKFKGEVRLSDALVDSRNIPTLRLYDALKPASLIRFLTRLGFPDGILPGPTLALGTVELSPYEITRHFGVFPRGGRRLDPFLVGEVKDASGKVLYQGVPEARVKPRSFEEISTHRRQANALDSGDQRDPAKRIKNLGKYPLVTDPKQVLDPRVAYILTQILRRVVDQGTAQRAKSLPFPVAGKTGTTNESKDAWFIGYSSGVLTGVWVGYDDARPLGEGESGAQAALPIWMQYMTEQSQLIFKSGRKWTDFPVPSGIIFSQAGLPDGMIPDAFIAGTEPRAGTGLQQSKAKASDEGGLEW